MTTPKRYSAFDKPQFDTVNVCKPLVVSARLVILQVIDRLYVSTDATVVVICGPSAEKVIVSVSPGVTAPDATLITNGLTKVSTLVAQLA